MAIKRVLITGGASGLGKALAFQFAQKGFHICIGDINAERGAETVTELEAMGAVVMYRHCDVTRVEDLQDIRDELELSWGGVDVVINNAGVAGTAGAIEDVSLDDWEWVLDINVLGVVRGCKVFTPLFKKQRKGYFINIASAAGLLNAPLMANYNASKSAVISLSETLRTELGGYGIDISVVCPAFFPTNLTESMRSHIGGVHGKVNKMMANSGITADDVAEAVYNAYSKREFYVVTHRLERHMWHLKRAWPDAFQRVMNYKSKKLFRNRRSEGAVS